MTNIPLFPRFFKPDTDHNSTQCGLIALARWQPPSLVGFTKTWWKNLKTKLDFPQTICRDCMHKEDSLRPTTGSWEWRVWITRENYRKPTTCTLLACCHTMPASRDVESLKTNTLATNDNISHCTTEYYNINPFATRPVAATGFQTTAAYYTRRGNGVCASQL